VINSIRTPPGPNEYSQSALAKEAAEKVPFQKIEERKGLIYKVKFYYLEE